MTPVIEHAGVEGTRPRVIVDGLPHRMAPGERLDVSEDAAREHLDAGTVRLVDDADASVPTGDEREDDKGEAVGTDADAPTPSVDGDAASDASADDAQEMPVDKDELIAEIHKLDESIKADARMKVETLQGKLLEARGAASDAS